ncbi:MAG: hypothetical protein LBF38_10335, partial [Deltaproteobacteria bacterium]|nr:hypothetical protein [Deltaproteobacteria bacterium]
MLTLDGTIALPGAGKISLDLMSIPDDKEFYEYILVKTKDNNILNASNVTDQVTHLGTTIDANKYKVEIEFIDNLIKAGVSVQIALTSEYFVWTGQNNGLWDTSAQNWLSDGSVGSFTAGGIVNFDNDGAFTEIDISSGVSAAGVYVRGWENYSFKNGKLTIDSSVGSWSDNAAASGKLVLGAFARGADDVAIANFKGTLDLTGTIGNSFENGIDLYTGRLLISTASQLGGELIKVSFKAAWPEALAEPINDLKKALTDNSDISEALDEYVRIIALARQNGSLPTILIDSGESVEFDGQSSNKQRLSLANDKSGAIHLESNANLTFEDSKADNGAAINLAQGSLFSLTKESGTGIFTFNNNQATANGGAISNQGLLSLTQATFSSNKAKDGGAIYNANGQVILIGENTFEKNTAEKGGAIYNENGQVILIGQNTFEENSAERGGAIFSLGAQSLLNIGPVNFVKNTATSQGGAIYLGSYGSASINLADNLTSEFSGNKAADSANSIHFAENNSFYVNLGENSTLTFHDPMSGEGEVTITQNGTGLWNLGGENVFSGLTTFSVNGGTLRLYKDAEVKDQNSTDVPVGKINLSDSGSSFNLASGAVLELGGGNSIAAGTINLAGGSTLAFNLDTAATSPALILAGTTSVIGEGKIKIDFTTLDLWDEGNKEYVLVDSSNVAAFTAQNVNTVPTLRGEEITAYSLGGGSLDITIDGGDIKASLNLITALPSEILTWLGSGNGAWNITSTGNWLNASNPQGGFMHGDIVNFDASGNIPPAGIALNPGGVEIAGIYLSGDKNYSFTGGYLIANSDTGSWTPATDTAVSGKLTLGAKATDATTVTSAVFSGVLDLTGITGTNQFREGIDIYSGRLRVANSGQLGSGLTKLKFLTDIASGISDEITTVKTSLTTYLTNPSSDLSSLTDGISEITSAAMDATSNGTLATLIVAKNQQLSMDSQGGDQNWLTIGSSGNPKAASIYLETGATFEIKNNIPLDASSLEGGAIKVFDGGFLSLSTEDETAKFKFTNNTSAQTGSDSYGGAIYNDKGTVTIENAIFEANTGHLGGAIRNVDGLIILKSVEFNNNSNPENMFEGVGGAINNSGNSLLIVSDSKFIGNHVRANSGGIDNNSTSVLL